MPVKNLIKLKNYDKKFKNLLTTVPKKRNEHAPKQNTNILICGYSGSGKTNLVLNMIYDLLWWDNLYVYAKDLTEDKYAELLADCEEADSVKKFNYIFSDCTDDLIDIDSLDKTSHNLLIFDDYCCDKDAMQVIQEYFIRGRKKNCTVVFITQSYYAVPKIIRLNCQYFIFFKCLDDREILEVFKSHGGGLTREDFIATFKKATNDRFSFLCIDRTASGKNYLKQNFNLIN